MTAVVLLCACGGYRPAEDAPDWFGGDWVDPRLGLMQAFGQSLSPIVRNVRTAHGKLFRHAEVETMMRNDLRPLDIVLVRSRPALTRTFIPSRYTHALVWLGSEAELRAHGLWKSAALDPYRAAIRSGLTVIESSKDDVHLSTFSELVDVDALVVLRPRHTGLAHAKLSTLLSRVGTPFDVAFDLSDASRLTCAELIVEAFPEFGVPKRYAAGRMAIIPDDLARLALEGSRHLGFRIAVRAEGGRFHMESAREALERLSSPDYTKRN
ncbi:MAG: YiiX/YebB-like N1pC/P60 family cysteine hydrolase [Rhizobiaceae bacterium]